MNQGRLLKPLQTVKPNFNKLKISPKACAFKLFHTHSVVPFGFYKNNKPFQALNQSLNIYLDI